MSTRQNSNLMWVNAARLAVVAVPIALTTYWHLHYAGLYWLIVQVQLWIFGSYVPVFTWLLVLLILLLPGIPLIWCVERFLGFPPGSTQRPEESSIRFYQFVRANRDYMCALGFVAAGFGVGGYLLGRAYFAGPMCVTSALRLDAGEPPASAFVEITGFLLTSERLTIERTTKGCSVPHAYVPLTSTDRLTGAPVQVLVQMPEARLQGLRAAAHPVTLRGLVTHDISGFVRDEFRKRGVSVADDAWLLEEGETPENLFRVGFAILGGMGGFGLILGVIALIVRGRGFCRPGPVRRQKSHSSSVL